jgi:hypothetical protein
MAKEDTAISKGVECDLSDSANEASNEALRATETSRAKKSEGGAGASEDAEGAGSAKGSKREARGEAKKKASENAASKGVGRGEAKKKASENADSKGVGRGEAKKKAVKRDLPEAADTTEMNGVTKPEEGAVAEEDAAEDIKRRVDETKKAKTAEDVNKSEERVADEPENAASGSAAPFVVAKSVKNFLRSASGGTQIGRDFFEALNAKVSKDIKQAMLRATSNGRTTVCGMDL